MRKSRPNLLAKILLSPLFLPLGGCPDFGSTIPNLGAGNNNGNHTESTNEINQPHEEKIFEGEYAGERRCEITYEIPSIDHYETRVENIHSTINIGKNGLPFEAIVGSVKECGGTNCISTISRVDTFIQNNSRTAIIELEETREARLVSEFDGILYDSPNTRLIEDITFLLRQPLNNSHEVYFETNGVQNLSASPPLNDYSVIRNCQGTLTRESS
jgi:hypothetical protein